MFQKSWFVIFKNLGVNKKSWCVIRNLGFRLRDVLGKEHRRRTNCFNIGAWHPAVTQKTQAFSVSYVSRPKPPVFIRNVASSLTIWGRARAQAASSVICNDSRVTSEHYRLVSVLGFVNKLWVQYVRSVGNVGSQLGHHSMEACTNLVGDCVVACIDHF